MDIFRDNCCDGIYNSFDIHFTSACDNKCKHCIDSKYEGLGIVKPDVAAIVGTIVDRQEGYDDVLFLGGEPCLFLEELLDCVKQIQDKTTLKVFVTTSVPKTCYDEFDKFEELLRLVDGINLSVQHYAESTADFIRQTTSKYDRQAFYASLPYKEKIRLNLNLVSPVLSTYMGITKCLQHYDKMGFNSIKLSEIQNSEKHFVSFESIFKCKLGSPFSSGCQSYLNMDDFIPNFKTPVLLKRSCFACEVTLKASFMDGVKVLYKYLKGVEDNNKYGVIYSNGQFNKGWL